MRQTCLDTMKSLFLIVLNIGIRSVEWREKSVLESLLNTSLKSLNFRIESSEWKRFRLKRGPGGGGQGLRSEESDKKLKECNTSVPR